jgi:hypothetical protein
MKAWITKYALTGGIREVEGEVSTGSDSMLVVHTPGTFHSQYFHGADWHTSRDAAVRQAEKMRQRRIKSLKESLAKMEQLSF